MAIVRLHKPLKIRKIKDDTLVDPYVQITNEFRTD